MAAQDVYKFLTPNGLNNGKGAEGHLPPGILDETGKCGILATISAGRQQTACPRQFRSPNQDGLTQRPRKSEVVPGQMKPGELAIHERTLQVSPEISCVDADSGCRNELDVKLEVVDEMVQVSGIDQYVVVTEQHDLVRGLAESRLHRIDLRIRALRVVSSYGSDAFGSEKPVDVTPYEFSFGHAIDRDNDLQVRVLDL